jgi:myo-inositol 2-dehydrogenase/D-chiro-inositol 1-dehydrogenase/scyllo-inositol 2-dehydrogenase (NAD+)
MIGAGRVGKLHSGTIKRYLPGADVVAIVDPAAEILNETGDEFGIDGRFASLEEALDKAEFDAVVITTPTFTHRDLTTLAADRGKHVFCEKPMAMTLEECDIMIDACARNGVVLQIGFMRRFDPEFVHAAEQIHNGAIGEIMQVKSLTHGPGLPPMWANDITRSNGMLAEVNSHDLDCVRWLVQSNIQRIYVETANFKGDERGVPFENFYDTMFATLRFDSGALGNIGGVCPCDYGYDARVEIIGKKGIMQIGEMQGKAVTICIDREQGLITPMYKRWQERFAMAYINEIEHFIECVANETTPRVTGEDGRWAVAGVLAGTKSLLEGRPVMIEEVLAS